MAPKASGSGPAPPANLAVEHENQYISLSETFSGVSLAGSKRKVDADEQVYSTKVEDKLPAGAQFQEDESWYPQYLEADTDKQFDLNQIHRDYRGVDRTVYNVGKPIDKDRYTMVQINDKKPGVQEAPEFYGWPSPQYDVNRDFDPKVEDRRCLNVAFATDTQSPCIKIRISRPAPNDKKRVVCHIYANSISRTPQTIGVAMKAGSAVSECTDLPNLPVIAEMADKNQLWRIDLNLLEYGDFLPRDDAEGEAGFEEKRREPKSDVPIGRPRFTGISERELLKLKDKYDKGQALKEADRFLASLYSANSLSLFMFCDPVKHAPEIDRFSRFFRTALYAATQLGNMWHYTQNGQRQLSDPDYDYETAPPPRFVVTEFNVSSNSKGMPIGSEPVKWESFTSLEYNMAPDVGTFAFSQKLALHREGSKAERDIDAVVNSESTNCLATFIENGSGVYVANVTIGGITREQRFQDRLPEIRKRCQLGVNANGIDYIFSGTVIEDHFETRCDFAIELQLKGNQEAPRFPDEKEVFQVSLQMIKDNKAINREINAVDAIQGGQYRKNGVYMPEIAFREPRPADQATNSISKLMAQGTKQRKQFEDEIKRHGLNQDQVKAAQLSVTSMSGVVLIHGPPGTGKTKTCMAIVAGFVAAGHRVLVTAPSNDAVDADLAAFAKNPPANCGDFGYCRFRDAFYRTEMKQAPVSDAKKDAEGDVEMAASGATEGTAGKTSDDPLKEHFPALDKKAADKTTVEGSSKTGEAEDKMDVDSAAGPAQEQPSAKPEGAADTSAADKVATEQSQATATSGNAAAQSDGLAGKFELHPKPTKVAHAGEIPRPVEPKARTSPWAIREKPQRVTQGSMGSWAEFLDDKDQDETVALSPEERRAGLWELVMLNAQKSSTGQDRGFATQKLEFIKSVAEGKNLPAAKAEAISYLAMLDQLKTPIDKNDKSEKGKQKLKELKKIRKEFRTSDDTWTGKYLKWCKVIFATNSSSSHDAVMDFFKPTVNLGDEAGRATPPDDMTPLAAHMESIELVIRAGDPKQLKPVVTSKGVNEVIHVMETSIFSRMLSDPNGTYDEDSVMLTTQYRMHPHLSAWPNKEFYGGRLQDAPSVQRETGIHKTLQEVFGPGSKNAWSGRYRVGVDVPGESDMYPGTTSVYNPAEADAAVDAACRLINHEPRADGAEKITPAMITIVSPYQGQRRAIISRLFEQQGCRPAVSVMVRSTSQMQGSESRLVILSMVKNVAGEPMDIGFINDPQQLCVELTRAKEALIIFGNWRGWCSEWLSHRTDKSSRMGAKYNETFRSFVGDMYTMKDIISKDNWTMMMGGYSTEVARTFYDTTLAAPPRLSDKPPRGGPGNQAGGPRGKGPRGFGDRR